MTTPRRCARSSGCAPRALASATLAQRFPNLSRSGIRKIVMNRAYLGEQRVPDPDKPKGSDLIVLRDNQEPLVTEPEYQAANAVQGQAPKHNGLAETTLLSGVVRCGLCGAKLFVLATGRIAVVAPTRARHVARRRCRSRRLSPPLMRSSPRRCLGRDKDPHVVAVLEGDTRYADALRVVEQGRLRSTRGAMRSA